MTEVYYSDSLVGLDRDEANQFIFNNIVYHKAPDDQERITRIRFVYKSFCDELRYEYGRLTVWMDESNTKIMKIRGMG